MSESEMSRLPHNWCWTTLEQISWDAGYGTSVKCDYEASGPPVLRIPNLSGSRIRLDDLKFATNQDGLIATGALAPGDLLIIRTNGSKSLIGRSGLVRVPFLRPHYFASYLIRFRLVSTDGLPEYIALLWQSPLVRDWIEKTAATSAGQFNISMGALNKLILPLPPTAEQKRIVAEIEKQFSRLDAAVAALKRTQANLKRYRAAVLRAACEGRLVPTEAELARQEGHDYEPADALLQRILR